MANRKPYPSDIPDAEWEFCMPYLTLMKEDAPQREHPLRELFNALRWFVRAGCPWRMIPHDLAPWARDPSADHALDRSRLPCSHGA